MKCKTTDRPDPLPHEALVVLDGAQALSRVAVDADVLIYWAAER